MLDINFIRQNPEKVKKGCLKKQVDIDINRLLELDEKRIGELKKIEALRAEQNKISRQSGGEKGIDESIKRAKALKEKIKEEEERFKTTKGDFDELMFKIPNLPFDDVPEGKDERGNIVVKKNDRVPNFKFPVRNHLEIGEELDLIDVKRAAKVSGTRFGYLKNEAVLLEFALISFAFDNLVKEGFIPIIPPVLMKPKMLKAMGYLDTKQDREERYFLEKDDLFLAGTSEQPIGAMHQGEILEEKDLPKRYIGFSSCFREEAGSYGKDTKGILRVHQFDKVEMFSFCHPEKSKEEHKFLVSLEEKLIKELKLPYQLVHLCGGDSSRVSASTFDIEVWMPGQNKYRETNSCSNCTDFQSRRLNIRYQDSKTNNLEFVHTLNGTVFAIGRILIAIIENYQTADGRIEIPDVLTKYLNSKTIPFIPRKKN